MAIKKQFFRIRTIESGPSNPDHRIIDLSDDGVMCLPVVGHSNFSSVHAGPEFHHHQGCMEFCYCLRGNLVFDTPETAFDFRPGQVFVSAPNQPHRLRTNPPGLIIYHILFKIPHAHSRILGLDANGTEWLVRSLTHLPRRIFASTPAIRSSFDRIFSIYDHTRRKSAGRKVRLQSASLDLLIAIIEAARRLPPKAPDALIALAQRIRDNPATKYTNAALAKEFKLSASSFANAFKRATGLPLHAFVINARIDRGKRLLRETRSSVAAISHTLGFYSSQHFSKAFKRITGINPCQFRET